MDRRTAVVQQVSRNPPIPWAWRSAGRAFTRTHTSPVTVADELRNPAWQGRGERRQAATGRSRWHPFGAIIRDDVLDNTSLYWFTNTATSAARLYWQQGRAGGNFAARGQPQLFSEELRAAFRSLR